MSSAFWTLGICRRVDLDPGDEGTHVGHWSFKCNSLLELKNALRVGREPSLRSPSQMVSVINLPGLVGDGIVSITYAQK